LKDSTLTVSDIFNRSFRLGKAYIDRVRDAIDDKLTDAENNLAKDELDRSPGDPDRDDVYDSSPDALMRRAEARIAAARRAADANLESARAQQSQSATAIPAMSTNGKTDVMPVTPPAEDPNAADYRVLALEPGSDFAAVQAAYEKLAARCDTRRFPDGSAEQKQAGAILERVNAAYENLRKVLSPTESRFGKLELE
jgi:hypothetical protein